MSPAPVPRTPSLWRELAAIILRKHRPSTTVAAGYPAGQRFPVVNGPVSGILIELVIVGLVCDAPLSLVVVALSQPDNQVLIHAAIAAFGLMTLGWAIAGRSVLRALPHVVSRDALCIGGMRHTGVVPKAAIESALAISASRHTWMADLGLRRDQVILASGFDPPNLAIEIRADATGMVKMAGGHELTTSRRWVLLYADSPAMLIEATRSSGR